MNKELFKNPGKEYRGVPFWSWNTKLNSEMIDRQIADFSNMGMGGFCVHSRTGLDTEYLGPEFIKAVRHSVEEAKEKDLVCYLYDEDRWPSGYGGGMVTKDKNLRSKYLVLTPFRQGTKEYPVQEFNSRAATAPHGHGTFLAAYDVRLNADGTLAGYERCPDGAAEPGETRRWYVYLEAAQNNPWYNDQSYVDTLNPEAIRRFIECTHEVYYRELGDEFGKTIPAIFTDEPQYVHRQSLGNPWAMQDVILPFTDSFPDTFREQYGVDFFGKVPELLWELPDHEISLFRYQYQEHISERFAQAFGDQIGRWCKEHGINLCGHVMMEPKLYYQTQAVGEAMRILRGFQLPGVDILCDFREYTTVKQAESVSHQFGRQGVLSELTGVTNWDFDFRRHKLHGDWQAALGVTVRVHHLTWMSMAGESKRDYPASIGYQSPWYEKYPLIEDHFARVNTVLRCGRPVVKVGMIHPIESCWLYCGNNQQTGQIREALDEQFAQMTEWLLFGMIDFDYISESLLPGLLHDGRIGEMEYDVILVAGCRTLRQTTLNYLKQIKELGKQVIFAGDVPEYVDAVKSKEILAFARGCRCVEFSQNAVLDAMDDTRTIEMRYEGQKHLKKPNEKKNWDGIRTDKYIYQQRQDGEEIYYFIAHGRPMDNEDLVLRDDVRIRLKGTYDLEKLDTMTGESFPVESWHKEGHTCFLHTFYEQDSLLIRAVPARCIRTKQPDAVQEKALMTRDLFREPVTVTALEPNVLVLDIAEYAYDDGPWEEAEEILRLDNECRRRAGYPPRRAALVQPYTVKEQPEPEHQIRLRYRIRSEITVSGVEAAFENLDSLEMIWDGVKMPVKKDGCYIDPCIGTMALPVITPGIHQLEVTMPFGQKTNLEAGYLLGDFGVRIEGASAVLAKRPDGGSWSSADRLGMPFYGGNVIYHTEAELEAGKYALEVSKYRGALLEVIIDGKKAGEIFLSPYEIRFSVSGRGRHSIDIICYGNRINTFGTLHDCDEKEVYFEPNSWRTREEGWAYEYQIRRMGILKAPVVKLLESTPVT